MVGPHGVLPDFKQHNLKYNIVSQKWAYIIYCLNLSEINGHTSLILEGRIRVMATTNTYVMVDLKTILYKAKSLQVFNYDTTFNPEFRLGAQCSRSVY